MAKGKLRKVAVIGAAIGGVIFFWRKRKAKDAGLGTASSPTIDYGAVTGTPEPAPEPEPESAEPPTIE
jgi:hypothetical protein